MQNPPKQTRSKIVDIQTRQQAKGAGKGIKVRIMTEYFEEQHIVRQVTFYKTLSTNQDRIAETVYRLKENDLRRTLIAGGWTPPEGM